jgi:diaminohydroxyphosphoribosylaminopyrimidine deaminase/5-amino-6-(5-phosphoribosylamino)uracil reductase
MPDLQHMQAALALARRGLGNVWPNPAVGCVLVKDGQVVGRGWTQPGGRPHAEVEALRRAGGRARGATAYVTLEPCCHWGKTPPCTDAFIEAGIARAVVALRDPDPRVNGEGLMRLKAAGIVVEEGLCGAEAAHLNAGFIRRMAERLPLVTLKLATTLDGRIAARSGETRWITGEVARKHVHMQRARNDAIMVGSGTVLADDPDLTCRIPGLVHARPDGTGQARPGPVRVVVDGRLRIPLTSRVVATARAHPTWLITLEGADRPRLRALAEAGVTVLAVRPDAAQRPDMHEALAALAGRGITRVLAEGGATLAATLLKADLVDRLAWFHAGTIMGADGRAAVEAFGDGRLAALARFRRVGHTPVGADTLTLLER